MAFDQDLVDAVLKNADIVKVISSYISLKKQGRDYVGLCPFHDDSNPSMHVSPEKRLFKCFVCGVGGSAITFVQKHEHVPFFEALKTVAEISGFDDPRLHKEIKAKPIDERKAPVLKCAKDLTTYYQYALNTEEGKEGLEYFESRHLDAAIRDKYKLGYAPKDGVKTCKLLQSKGHSLKTIDDLGIAFVSNGSPADKNQGRVIFPICDADGNVIAYSARRIKDGPEAKYVNSPESILFHKSSVLYNYHIAKEKARHQGYIYVLEGFMDVFALSKIGIDSAVAIMGTALTREHIQLLRALNVEVRVCLDGDKAGQDHMLEIAKNLQAAGLNYSLVDNQGSSKDPDEILNEDGEDRLRAYLSNLIGYMDFALNYYKRTNPLKTMNERKALVAEFIPFLKTIKDSLEFDSYIRKLANVTGFEPESIRALVIKARNEPDLNPNTMVSRFHPERKVLRKLQIAEREYLYQMLHNSSAIEAYDKNFSGFYDDLYRQIALFVVEYFRNHHDIDYVGVIAMLEMSDLENKQELIDEVVAIVSERNHPTECTTELIQNLIESMLEERENISEDDALREALEGKPPLEQARIYAEFNKRKMKKANKKDDQK